MNPVRVSISWSTPFSNDLWTHLQSVAKFIDDENDALSIYCTPSDPSINRMAGLLAVRGKEDTQRVGCSDAILACRLIVFQRPAEPAPDEFWETTARTSDTKRFLEIVRALESDELQPATYECITLVESASEKGLHAPALARGESRDFERLSKLGVDYSIEQFGVRFVNGTLGLREASVIYLHEDDSYSVNFDMRSVLEITESLQLPRHDEAERLVLDAFIEKVEKA